MFTMTLVDRSPNTEFPAEEDPPAGWPEMDDSEALAELCGYLADLKRIDFIVSGFGDTRWPVHIWPDCAIAIEQVPDLIEALEMGHHFELDFFEQGVERMVKGVREGDMVRLECTSETLWKPDPIVELERLDHFRAMLEAFLGDFGQLAGAVAPFARSHPALARISGGA